MICTAVVNCHDEGRLAWRAFRAALRALQKLESGELILMLDAPNGETEECAKEFAELYNTAPHPIRVLVGQSADLGEARNAAANEARGEFVAFLDADDVWGANWLVNGIATLAALPSTAIAHPQVNVNFELDNLWWEHKDCRDPTFDPSTFLITNHWTALSLARKSTYLAHPYMPAGNGYGFEDWEWNTRTLAEGVLHIVVPETVHFIRRAHASMTQRHAAQNRVTMPNKFFDQRWVLPPNSGDAPKTELGEWLVDEWKRAHEIETELWPNQRELAQRPQYVTPSAPALYDGYFRVRAVIPENVTHLILFAGLGGGADLRAKLYADAITKAGGKPILVATDGKSSGFDGQDTYEISPIIQSLQPPEQSRLIQRLMLQFKDRAIIHIVNSRVAWMALAQNTEVFAGQIFASLYAFELARVGALSGYVANGCFTAGMKGLAAVITDNDPFRNELKAIMGWTRTVVAPTPIEVASTELQHKEKGEGLRVLWASRIDWNKNPDLLFDIAVHCLASGEHILFDVAGDSADYHGFVALQKLKNLPNVKIRGPFKAFAQLQPERYDVFLFTSHKEGMPNVVLEAMAAGLPVVTTPAGGLSQCATDGFPGRVVTKTEDMDAWVRYIKKAAEGTANPKKWLKERHTFDKFAGPLAAAGYFASITQKAETPAA